MSLSSSLPWLDQVALIWFFICWFAYVWFAKQQKLTGKQSLLEVVNQQRILWMKQASLREQRNVDAFITSNLSTAPSFFASTTIIIIGGVLAMLASNETVADIFAEVAFSEPTTKLIFELKIFLLLGIFVFAFFRFSWSIRQYTFAAIALGAMPDYKEFHSGGKCTDSNYAKRAGHLFGLAAEAFNAGIRAYYFAFAALCWFFSPLIFILASIAVVLVVYYREFKSEVLDVLTQE
jgi:uncharacterized membrane protein